jgi:thiamine transporter ThiT
MKTNIKSALVTTLLMGILAMAGYIIGVGDIFKLNTHVLINSGVMAVLAGIVSLIKSYGTTDHGTFAGVQIK